jgi:hypothetical protein
LLLLSIAEFVLIPEMPSLVPNQIIFLVVSSIIAAMWLSASPEDEE